MAQDIKLDFAAGPTATLATEDITDGNPSTLSASVDLGDPGPVALGFEFKVAVLTSADDFIFLEAAWSHDNSDFSDLQNMDLIATVQCVASTTVEFVGAFAVKAQYIKFRYRNESGGTVDGDPTPPTLVLTDITYDQA